MISTEEADKFLSQQLQFTNWKNVKEKDNLEFLKLLVPYYAHNIYFQNISLSSISEVLRKVPGERDIIQAGLNGVGGNCITQNAFLMLLLKALDFDAFIVSGMVKGPTNDPDNHVLCVVRLNEQEMYLLDLGVGLPFAEPIPLHNLHDAPYINRAAGYRYLYRKLDNGLYECVQLDGALMGEPYESNKDTEYVRYDFTLEPRTIEFFKKPLTPIFMDREKSIFLQCPFLFRYFVENEDGEMLTDPQLSGDRKFILIRGADVLIGTNETKLVKHISSNDDMKDIILNYFPRLSKEDVEKSLQNFGYCYVPKKTGD